MPALLDNRTRLRHAVLFQWIAIGISVVALVSDAFQYRLLRRLAAGEAVPDGVTDANDWRQQVVGGVQMVLLLMAFIALVLWFYRAYGNLHRLPNTPRPQHSAGAAAWGWFVPVINLWYPLQMMKEIWYLTQRYAQPDDAIRYQPDGSLIGGWWALRLVTIFVGRAVRLPSEGSSMDNFLLFGALLMGVELLCIWYAGATLYLLKKMEPFERQLAARFADDAPASAAGWPRPDTGPDLPHSPQLSPTPSA